MRKLTIMGCTLLMMASLLGCGGKEKEANVDTNVEVEETTESDTNVDTEEVIDEDTISAPEEDVDALQEEVSEAVEESSKSLIPGVYVGEFEEEMEGDLTVFFYNIVLKEDGTGIWDGQDRVDLTWKENTIDVTGTQYNCSFDGNKLILSEGGIETAYKLAENTPVDEFIENMDNPEYLYDVQMQLYEYCSFVDERAEKNTYSSYDEIIALLQPGEAYAYIEMLGYDGELLLVSEYSYEYEEGLTATINGYVYGKVNDKVRYMTVVTSDGTARPIANSNGVLYSATQHGADADFCIPEGDAVMAKFSVVEEYDTDGNTSYSGFVRDTNSFDDDHCKWISTEEEYKECYEEYLAADIVKVTVVE